MLDLIQQRTAHLVALQLRSASVVIAHLAETIEQAVQFGHPHRRVHEAVNAGGLVISWNSYRVSLRRARKARRQPSRATRAVQPAERPAAPTGAAPLLPEAARSHALAGVSSNADVLAALEHARRTATKDYARIAREKYRRPSARERAGPDSSFEEPS